MWQIAGASRGGAAKAGGAGELDPSFNLPPLALSGGLLEKRLAGIEYRGVILPEGMSRECLDEISNLLAEHERKNHYDEDDAPMPEETAVKVFAVVQAHRA